MMPSEPTQPVQKTKNPSESLKKPTPPHAKPNPQSSKPQNPQSSKPQNPQSSKPQNPQSSKPQNPQSSKPQPHSSQSNKPQSPQSNKPTIEVSTLKSKTLDELYSHATSLGIDNHNRNSQQELIFMILKRLASKGHPIINEGSLEIVQDGGYGFLRSPFSSYIANPDDVYVSPSFIRRMNLRTGDTIRGVLRPPKDNERYFALANVIELNYTPPSREARIIPFRDLTAEFPREWLNLESSESPDNMIARAVDIVAPIGKGQRMLIVAPPKTGKTMLLQSIASSIVIKHPETIVIYLGIDERPEEETAWRRNTQNIEVVASTFDEPASRHVQVADMVLAKAKRLVEHKRDVVIILDSLTRLARAYNTVTPASGKVLTGGIDANALQRPKRFFGAARAITGGGSLTIIATALVDTGSKMDEVIYEEFNGTGNSEIHLSRKIAQKRTYPAININASSTRREDLLVGKDILSNCWILRKYLQTMEPEVAIDLLITRLHETKTNKDFWKAMKSK